jgi:protein O-GlcNAc transferase
MIHQEYIGTSGGLFVDYHFTDLITTPINTQDLFVEKLIYMPNHFFSKGHAYQAEVKQPTYEYTPKVGAYRPGTGTPSENRCLAPLNVGPSKPSFVFCNFNKILKNNPETLRSWIRILREVPDSMLCLMENPDVAIPYVRRFIHEAAGTSDGADPSTFVPGDGDALNQRIHFLPWEKNPFDHQMRNQDFCNVMLDSHPYNGHTVAQDALYGGVPIVTRSDGKDMSSRVTTSGNIVLGIEELNAYGGSVDYEKIAIQLGTNFTKYDGIRKKLIASALQRNPMHPYWDVARYVKNFETGLYMAWSNFLEGNLPRHIYVDESEQAKRGTYDEEILANPPQGKTNRKANRANKDEL